MHRISVCLLLSHQHTPAMSTPATDGNGASKLNVFSQILGAPLVEMGAIEIDNLGSGRYDEKALVGLSLNPLSASGSVIGRALALYTELEPDAVLAVCVIGAREPTDLSAVTAPCTPCTHSLQQQQSLYDVAEFYRVSWLSVWSLNLDLRFFPCLFRAVFTCVHVCICVCTRLYVCVSVHMRVCVRNFPRTIDCTHARTNTRTHTHTHTHTQTGTHTHKYTHTHGNTHTQTRTHMNTNSLTNKRTVIFTYTHTPTEN